MPTLIDNYKSAATAHGEGTKGGDSTKTNKAHDDLVRVLGELTARGEDTALLGLFDDPDVWVQLWAVAHTLEVDEKLARTKLQSIMDAGIPLASMDARYTLQGWDSGDLKFRS